MFQVFSIDPLSSNFSPFGDEVFLKELSRVKDKLIIYREIMKWTQYGLLLLACLVLILVLSIARKKRKQKM